MRCPICNQGTGPEGTRCASCGTTLRGSGAGSESPTDHVREWLAAEKSGARLTTCSDCDHAVSRRAEACPACGAPVRPRPPVTVGTIALGVFLGLLLWAVVPVVLLLIFGAGILASFGG